MIIGIIGEIGSGKSFVAECFRKLGASVFNADLVVNSLYKEDKRIKIYAKKKFPEVIVNDEINKSKLLKYFLCYDEKWLAFEVLVHHIVLQKLNIFLLLERKIKRRFVILDVPLLLEKKMHLHCDIIIFVCVNQAIRYQRLNKRDINKEKLTLIQNIQISVKTKRKLSNFIINTGINSRYIFSQAKEIVNIITNNST